MLDDDQVGEGGEGARNGRTNKVVIRYRADGWGDFVDDDGAADGRRGGAEEVTFGRKPSRCTRE